jgi:hypothetical protein
MIACVSAEIRSEHIPNTSLELYLWTDQFCLLSLPPINYSFQRLFKQRHTNSCRSNVAVGLSHRQGLMVLFICLFTYFRLRAGRPRNLISIRRGRRFFSSPRRQDRLRVPWVHFPGREADDSPPPIAEVKNTRDSSYVFMA